MNARYSRTARAVNLALLLLLFVGSLWVYPALPDQIPQHRGFGGDVTYWDTTLIRWLANPLVATLFVGIGYAAAYGAARTPQRVLESDIPNKEIYRTLSFRHKRIVTDIFRTLYHAAVTPSLIGVIISQVNSYLLALSPREAPAFMSWLELGLMLGGTLGLLPLFYLWGSRSIQRFAEREARSRPDDAE